MLKPKQFGFAGGLIWGVCMALSTILSLYTGFAKQWLIVMSGIYPGYTISWWGSVLGLIYGFLDGFIGLFLLAWIYNKLTRERTRAKRKTIK